MHINKISIGRGKKLSINYNSYDYHVSISLDLNDDDNIEKAHKLALSTIKVIEMEEIKRLKEEMQ